MRALKRALANAPSLAEAHDLAGRLLMEVDEIEEARARLAHAAWLDASNVFTRIDLMRAAAYAGDWDEVVAFARKQGVTYGPRCCARAFWYVARCEC